MIKATMNKAMIAMMAMLLVFMAACSNSNSNSNSGTEAPTASSESTGEEKPVVIDPLGKYDTPITISTVRAIDPNTKYRDGESLDNNIWTKKFQEQLGIAIKNEWSVNADQYVSKLNVSIASSDLPDFMALPPTQFVQLVENDMLMDITDLVDTYASPLLKEIMQSDGGLSLETAKINGRLMGIPTLSSVVDSAQILYIRTDWLKKLGLDEPETMDDLIHIIEMFSTGDPDENGQQDTVGMLVSKEIWYGYPRIMGFFNGYHAYPNIWIKDADGQLAYGGIQPEMKTALGKLQELYKAGYIDQEFGVKDTQKVEETVAAGKVGVIYGAMWAPLTAMQAHKTNDPSAEWKAFPVLSADDKPAYSQTGAAGGYASFTGISKDMKNPEAVIKMLNLYVESNWGEQNDPALSSEEAVSLGFHKYPPVTMTIANKNLTQHQVVSKALQSKDTTGMNAEQKSTYEQVIKNLEGDISTWGQNRVFGEQSSYSVINEYVNNNLLMTDAMYLAPTPSMVQKKSTLDKMSDEMITRIILGASLDEFDKFVSDWRKLGGDEITKEINDAFAARN